MSEKRMIHKAMLVVVFLLGAVVLTSISAATLTGVAWLFWNHGVSPAFGTRTVAAEPLAVMSAVICGVFWGFWTLRGLLEESRRT